MIATIAEKKSSAIVTTTIAEIALFISQRSLSLRSLRSLESGFHMIAIIAAIAKFFSQRSQRW